jgi:RNA polymerase sigma factor (sigma-70 family)
MDEFLPQERPIPAMKVRKSDPVEPRTGNVEISQASQSFEELFQEHWNSIYRHLLRMTGDPVEAEDLALETFMKLYQQPPKAGDGYNPGGWLYRVATNLGLRSIRSFQRREHYEVKAGKGSLESAPENRPVELLESKEDHRMTRLALASMNPHRAEILVLRYSGLTYREIGKALNLSPTSIGPLLVRAEREFEKTYRALTQEEV